MQDYLSKRNVPRTTLRTTSEGMLLESEHVSMEPGEPNESMVEEYLRVFGRHRWLIAGFALLGFVASFVLGLRSLPVYRTRTSLEIRSLNGDFMNIRSVETTGNSSSAEEDTNLQTQIRLLQSDSLLLATMDRVLAEPHPAFVQRQDLLSVILRATHLDRSAPISYREMVQQAGRGVKVKPIGLTRLVEITCDSWSPELSAKFCNTLTSTFEDQDLQTRSSEATKTSEWLTRQVADVRQRAEDTQKKLEQAVGDNGLMLSQTSSSIGEERLHALQDELVKAEADRIAKEAEYGIAHTVPPDTIPGVQDNPAHRAYELKLADLRNQLANLVPPLTEENPKVIHLRSQIRDAEAGLHATETSSTSRESNEYTAAQHREALLASAFRAQQAVVSTDLQKIAQVSLLRRDLESEQGLYATLLQRAREAGFASAMQASTIRVVDEAQVPGDPFSPQRIRAGTVGIALGALAGVGFAFLRERRFRVFRLPGEVKRYLHVHELGVIPAVRRQSRRIASAQAKMLSVSNESRLADPAAHGDALSLTRWDDNFSVAAEAYRNVTLSILLAESDKRTRTYVISSPSASDGKTTVVSNLGVALSKARQKVVLLDGDLRKPNLHNAFRMSNDFGLRNILRGDVDLATAPITSLAQATSLANLSIIPAGKGDDDLAELLHSPRVTELLKRLADDFQIILIDTPPVLHMADARLLAGESDGAILVIRAGVTTLNEAADARDLFDYDRVNLLGTILNDFDPSREGKGSYYRSYYRYEGSGRVPDKAASAI
jgi:polysaccharide biosynthesis transport protein